MRKKIYSVYVTQKTRNEINDFYIMNKLFILTFLFFVSCASSFSVPEPPPMIPTFQPSYDYINALTNMNGTMINDGATYQLHVKDNVDFAMIMMQFKTRTNASVPFYKITSGWNSGYYVEQDVTSTNQSFYTIRSFTVPLSNGYFHYALSSQITNCRVYFLGCWTNSLNISTNNYQYFTNQYTGTTTVWNTYYVTNPLNVSTQFPNGDPLPQSPSVSQLVWGLVIGFCTAFIFWVVSVGLKFFSEPLDFSPP